MSRVDLRLAEPELDDCMDKRETKYHRVPLEASDREYGTEEHARSWALRARSQDPVIVWHKASGPPHGTDIRKAGDIQAEGQSGGETKAEVAATQTMPPPSYAPTTPPRPTRPASTDAPRRIQRRPELTSPQLYEDCL